MSLFHYGFFSIAASTVSVMSTASALQQVFLVHFEDEEEEEKKHEYHRRRCMYFTVKKKIEEQQKNRSLFLTWPCRLRVRKKHKMK